MSRPYIEERNIRTFTQDVDEFELVWHRDKEDRIIQTLHDTDWMFQLDNDIPRKLTNERLFIPRETYHRLIKGSGDLKLKVIKL